MTTTYIITSLALFALSLICELAERKSKLWYRDRLMLRGTGFFFGLGCIVLAMGIAL